MAALFFLGLLTYYLIVVRRHVKDGAVLAGILLLMYAALGVSGIIIAVTEGILPIFKPNYLSVLVLLVGIIFSISGFIRFRTQNISQIFGNIRGQKLIENILICTQFLAIGFFLPFAVSAITGDPNENRLLISDRIESLGSYGMINTLAGAASQLFSVSLVMAFIRLASTKNQGRNSLRASLLILSSLSYVIYILAYVGRDGVVYWIMTSVALYFVFRSYLGRAEKKRIRFFFLIGAIAVLIPFGVISASRFANSDLSLGWSFFEYFGAQIHNFSDYSSIDRPISLGIQNFPMFVSGGCQVMGLDCPSWSNVRDVVFDAYLKQGKAPWVFGTFVSDFVADFGNIGTLIILFVFSRFCSSLCAGGQSGQLYSFARLLLILFLFLIPYWGVFYFRFSIINGYIIVNLLFIFFIALPQYLPALGKKL